jgi:dCMP deaminase
MSTRPDWDPYFLAIAKAVAARGDCSRRQVGALIVDQDRRILATGYNGSPPGGPSCLAGECPRGRHYPVRIPAANAVMCGCAEYEWPCPKAVTPGSSYDTGSGACVALHAEQNALLFARASVKGATLYCTDAPCGGCARMITGAGITRIVIPGTLEPGPPHLIALSNQERAA